MMEVTEQERENISVCKGEEVGTIPKANVKDIWLASASERETTLSASCSNRMAHATQVVTKLDRLK